MIDGILYNCSAHVELNKTTKQPIVVGNASEQGIISYFLKNSVNTVEQTLNSKEKNIICIIPFDSQRKKSLTAITRPEDPQMVRIFVKGAPEFMLEVCSQYMTGEESSQTLDQHLKDEIIKNVIKNNFAK